MFCSRWSERFLCRGVPAIVALSIRNRACASSESKDRTTGELRLDYQKAQAGHESKKKKVIMEWARSTKETRWLRLNPGTRYGIRHPDRETSELVELWGISNPFRNSLKGCMLKILIRIRKKTQTFSPLGFPHCSFVSPSLNVCHQRQGDDESRSARALEACPNVNKRHVPKTSLSPIKSPALAHQADPDDRRVANWDPHAACTRNHTIPVSNRLGR